MQISVSWENLMSLVRTVMQLLSRQNNKFQIKTEIWRLLKRNAMLPFQDMLPTPTVLLNVVMKSSQLSERNVSWKRQLTLDRKNMTMESQNKDFHWVNHQMVENRVSGAMLDSSAPKANLLDVCKLKFLPSMGDQKCQRLNYIILCSRILADYFDVLAPLADACIQHIPHKYSNELSQKTKKVFFRSIMFVGRSVAWRD